MALPIQPGVPELCAVIRDRVKRSPHQQITFADFMALALYHPTYGYYMRDAAQLGMAGDFATSAHMGPDFAELLTEQFVEMWRHLGQPTPFHIVEMGAGQGLLANSILTYLQRQYPDCFAAVHYILIETSQALRTAQQAHLERWKNQSVAISWCTLEELDPDAITGCLFSNELVDALPVHQVVLTESGLQEQYVALNEPAEQSWTLTLGPLSTPQLQRYFEQAGIILAQPAYPLNYTTEVNLAALDWLKQVAQKLHRGYVLTIDYGYPAERYYSPQRSQGTLQCYYQHAHHNDPLINIGQQDITAHVNFTALEQHGQRCELETLGSAPQELFLMALGLSDRLQQLAQLPGRDQQTIRYALRRREALHQLINPMGLGKFTVLAQGKGLTTAEQRSLKGLTMPTEM